MTLLPERLRVGAETDAAKRVMGGPEAREVIGGDDMRYALGSPGVEEVFLDVLGMEQMRNLRNLMMPPARG